MLAIKLCKIVTACGCWFYKFTEASAVRGSRSRSIMPLLRDLGNNIMSLLMSSIYLIGEVQFIL